MVKLKLTWEERGPCPVFAIYTLAFALQLRKNLSQGSRRVPVGTMKTEYEHTEQNMQKISIHKHNNKNTCDCRIISDYFPNK